MIWIRRSARLLLLLVVASFAACDTQDQSPSPTGPDQLLGGLLGGGSARYTLVRDPILSGVPSLQLSEVIGVSGGTISLLGHTLTVPPGAVNQPSVFTLLVLPTGYVEVDLTATVSGLLGNLLNIGAQGFSTPVPVTLSYSRATNVKNPEDLTVVYLPGLLGYRNIQPVPSQVDTVNKTVTAELRHFSRYALAFP